MTNYCKLCSDMSVTHEEDGFKDYDSDHAIWDVLEPKYKLRLSYSDYEDGGIGNAWLFPEFKEEYETKYPVVVGHEKCGEFTIKESFDSDDYMMMFPIKYCPMCGRKLINEKYDEERDRFIIVK